MKHIVKFGGRYEINGIQRFTDLEHPILGIDPDSEDNIYIYISEDPLKVILGSSEVNTWFSATRYYGTGSSYSSANSDDISFSELKGDVIATYRLNLEPHVLSFAFICSPTDKDYLFVNSKVPEGMITVSNMILPEGARYVVRDSIQGELVFRESTGSTLIGWRLFVVTLYSYPEEHSEDWDQVQRFTEGQRVRFNLTMKNLNGEVILDNKQITLIFT